MNVHGCKVNKMPLMFVAICYLVGFFDSAQAQRVLVQRSPLQQQQFVQPHIEYGAWSPIDSIDYSLEPKINRVRSIASSPLDIQSVPRTANRRNFETNGSDGSKQQAVTVSTFRPTYKRRTFTKPSTTTTAVPTTKAEGNASNRFKNHRKNSTSPTSRRPFTARTTAESVLSSSTDKPQPTKPSPFKKPALTRGNFRPKTSDKEKTSESAGEEENYPEHFKQLIKSNNKEVNTQTNGKSVLKKPVKQFKPTERTPGTRPLFPTRQNRFALKSTSTSTTEASTTVSSTQSATVSPKRPLRSRPRPTEKTKISVGSTLQEPPTAKTTPTYATRSPTKHAEDANTPADELKQIDAPSREYFPRTSAVSIGSSSPALKYSSRFRNTVDIAARTSNKIPSYQATVPTITTTPAENASHILELLQKYQNETSDALVKSPNIFSLAKKTHQHDSSDSEQDVTLEFDNDLVVINDNPEEAIKSVFSTESTESTEVFDLPTTPFTLDTNSVSIFPNGYDISTTLRTTTAAPSIKLSSDSFENEISFEDKDFKTLTLPPPSSSEKISTRVTSSITSSTSRLLPSTTVSTTTTTTQPTTTEAPETTTSEDFIDKNFKILQQLLGKTVSIFSITTEVPTTTTTTTTPTTTTTTTRITTPSTTTTRLTTTPSTTVRTTPSTTTTTTTTRRRTTTTTTPPTTRTTTTTTPQTTRATTTTTPFTTTTTSTTRDIPTTTTTKETLPPISTTYKFRPIDIPSEPPVKTNTIPKKKAPFSDSEDLDFLRQLSSFLNRGALPTTRFIPPATTTTRFIPPTTTTTSTTSTTTTTTTTTTTPRPTTTTTLRIIPSTRLPTTHSEVDDLTFLRNLRDYAKIINLTTERTNLAQKILELAMNRTSKSFDSKQSASNFESLRPAPFVTTTTPSPDLMASKMTDAQRNINMMSAIIEENQNGNAQAKLSPQELEKTKQMLEKDLVQYNKDLQLLSLLIGRPLTDKDVAKLAASNLGKTKATFPQITTTSTTTRRSTTPAPLPTTTTAVPVFKPLSENEAKFLQALAQIQTTRSTTTTTSTSTEQPLRSQEAILAELLKAQGIGPGNANQAPIQKILQQLQAERLNRDATTTIRPFSPMPPRRQPRPIIDGLSWLWRTWQETAPGRPRQVQQPQILQPTDELSFDEEDAGQSSFGGGIGVGGGGGGDNLNYPSGNTSPLGPNGFLGAAIGVTRAVSRFLGVALTGAGQLVQVALGGSSASLNSPGGLGIFGGSRL